MTDREYVNFLSKCANIPYTDYSWLKDHCYKTLKRPCSPNTRNEHLAILALIEEHENRKVGRWINAEVLDKIRTEIIHLHDWAFSREEILRIIDKYREESEG